MGQQFGRRRRRAGSNLLPLRSVALNHPGSPEVTLSHAKSPYATLGHSGKGATRQNTRLGMTHSEANATKGNGEGSTERGAHTWSDAGLAVVRHPSLAQGHPKSPQNSNRNRSGPPYATPRHGILGPPPRSHALLTFTVNTCWIPLLPGTRVCNRRLLQPLLQVFNQQGLHFPLAGGRFDLVAGSVASESVFAP